MTAHEVTFEETAAYVRGCRDKRAFESKAAAREYNRLWRRRHHGPKQEPYSCGNCGAVHLTSKARSAE